MDGHLKRSFENFVVPEYQESSASPDIWGGWSMTSLDSPEKCFIMDHYDAMNHGFSGGLYGQIETGSVEDLKKLNVCGDLCGDSWLQGAKDGHRQLRDIDGIDQMDDIFLSSILEDVPGNWNLRSSSELSLKPVENVDAQCLSSSNKNIDSPAYVDSLSAFDQSVMMSDGRDVPVFPFVPCNSGPCHGMPLEGQPPFVISGLSEVKRSNECRGVMPSLEEVVLQDLQSATGKLTDETRKCFRDTFYRLAKKSSRQDRVSSSTNPEDCPMQSPCTRDRDQSDRIRSRRTCGTETETNSMDRAIADLTYNKMEFNTEMFPLSERISAVQASEGSSKSRTHHQLRRQLEYRLSERHPTKEPRRTESIM